MPMRPYQVIRLQIFVANFIKRICLSLALLWISVPTSDVSRAAEIYWNGTTAGWDMTSSWSTSSSATTPNPAEPPGASDIAHFHITPVNAPQMVDLNAHH